MASILVIDDEEVLLCLYKKVLTKFGHTVQTASKGEAGISLFENGKFELVITDVIMAGIDGNAVARIIKKGNTNIPVIGASGTPWKASHELFDSVLGKPFSIAILLGEVNHCLSSAVASISVEMH